MCSFFKLYGFKRGYGLILLLAPLWLQAQLWYDLIFYDVGLKYYPFIIWFFWIWSCYIFKGVIPVP